MSCIRDEPRREYSSKAFSFSIPSILRNHTHLYKFTAPATLYDNISCTGKRLYVQ